MKTVKTKMDIAAIKALVNYSMRSLYIIYPILAALVLFVSIQDGDIIFGGTFAVILCFFMWFIPFIQVSAQKKSRLVGDNIVNEFNFADNGDIKLVTVRDGKELSTANFNKEDIRKVKESKTYVFLYISKIQAFVIKKSDCDLETLLFIQGNYGKKKTAVI
jgi:hypothetical protein